MTDQTQEELAYIGVELGFGNIIVGGYDEDPDTGGLKAIAFRHSAETLVPGERYANTGYASNLVQYVAFKDNATIDRLIADLERLKQGRFD
jgi:hypothetical protein